MTVSLLSIDAAAKALSIGKTKLYSELAQGNIQAVKIGKRTLILSSSVDKYIAGLKSYSSQNAD